MLIGFYFEVFQISYCLYHFLKEAQIVAFIIIGPECREL